MSDLINRQDAIDAMYQLEAEDIERYGCSIPEGFDAKPAVEALEALPSADPERKKGELKTVGFLTCQCSECGVQFHELECTNFCPNCGTKWSKE